VEEFKPKVFMLPETVLKK